MRLEGMTPRRRNEWHVGVHWCSLEAVECLAIGLRHHDSVGRSYRAGELLRLRREARRMGLRLRREVGDE
jgi:hypothetical protein